MPGALLLPLLTAAAVLVVSGVLKLRTPSEVDHAFESLRVPRPLAGATVRRSVPWAEVALGVALLVTTGPGLVLAGALALVLFLAYLALVARALRGPEPADCGCFGALGDSRVTSVTVLRNVLLVVVAALTVLGGALGGGVRGALTDASPLAWVLTAALAAGVAVAVTWRSAPAAGTTGTTSDDGGHADDGYDRTPVPEVQVLTAAGRLVVVGEEARAAAQLLVFLRPGCGPCGRLGPLVTGWNEALAPVTVRAVVVGDPRTLERLPYLDGTTWFDPHGVTLRRLVGTAPSAVLVGADGFLAGGPVHGEAEVTAFVAEVRAHLDEALAGGVSGP